MKLWNNRAPTVLLMGRFQPWHGGHQALFEQALQRADQVLIAVRDTQGTDEKNPFDFDFVKQCIDDQLADTHAGRYQVMLIPNITNMIYGRDVGYKIEQVHLDAVTESISATQVRAQMKSEGII
jgi:cytidyltransferase-like protein